MDDKLTPMEAEILDMPEPASEPAPPTGEYGTAVPQRPKRDHTRLWIIGSLVIIAICTMSVIATTLQIRVLKDKYGKWVLTTNGRTEEAPLEETPKDLELPAENVPDRSQVSNTVPEGELSLQRGTAGSSDEALSTVYARVQQSVVCLELNTYFGSVAITGVILSEDGYLLSASDGLSSSSDVSAILSDGTQYDVTLVGKDELTGICLLKIEAQGLKAAEFADTQSLSVGDPTLCIGNPYGTQMRGVLHEGIVSALGQETVEGQQLGLLETSADFGAGKYGCPVYDRSGHVVALTSPIGMRMTRDGSEPVFAVCTTDLERIVTELMTPQPEEAVRVELEIEQIPSDYRKYFGYPGRLWVTEVPEGSAADGLICPWDVIVSVDGVEVDTVEEFRAAVAQHAPNDTVELLIYRGGRWYFARLPVVAAQSMY